MLIGGSHLSIYKIVYSADSIKRESLIGAEAYLLYMKKVMDQNSKEKTKDGQRPLREKS